MFYLPVILYPGYLRILLTVLSAFVMLYTQAQICNGSLGDPVVKIDFGTGISNAGFTATNGYIYTSSSCPDDGYYTITTSTSGCFGNSWHTVNSDHTGNGAFMLVNASFTPGDFVVATVKDLCPNTTYEFAAWLMNVINRNSIKPNISFNIETPSGTVLQQFSTGDIPESTRPEWKQYGGFFTTTSNNAEIVLRMTNNAPGGIGNDIALDDITFRPCGPLITSVIQGFGDSVNICTGNTSTYTLTSVVSSAFSLPVYQWQVSNDTGRSWQDIPGANLINYQRNPTVAGIFIYRLSVNEQASASNKFCRIASENVVIHVHPKPIVNAGDDRVMFAGDTVTLNGMVTGDNPSFFWDPPDYLSNINQLDPIASPQQEQLYTLNATSSFGCSNQDVVLLKVVAGIFVPTAFTPNNDGLNDRWRIPFLDPVLGATVHVYNRYGQLVYHAEGKIIDWDGKFNGKEQSSGSFVYHIQFKKGRPAMKGTFTLIR